MDEEALFIKHIEGAKASIVQALITGRAEDFAAYKEMCGRLHGLNTALLLLEEQREVRRKSEF